MKIGFDAKRALHNNRGLGNFSRTLLIGLEKYLKELEVHLYSPHVKEETFIKWKENHDQFLYHHPQSKFLSFFPSLWRSVLLTNDLKREDLDVYHGLSHELPPGIEKTDIKSVVTIHDLVYLRFPQYFSKIDRKVYGYKFKNACERANQIIAICHQTKDDIINYFNIHADKIEVHYQACHPQFYKSCDEAFIKELQLQYSINSPFLLFVGALEERKNALGLLRAYSLIASKIKQDLIIIGRGGKYKEKLYQLIDEFSLKSRVRILEDVPYNENPAFCQMADLMIYPSFFEGFGLPIVESMFSGTPIITSRGGVFPEAGGNAACYVNPKDPQEMGNAILTILSSENLQKEMIENGFLKAKEFHIDKTSKKLMDLYKSL